MHSSQRLCRLCAKSFEVSSLLHIFRDAIPNAGSLEILMRRYLPYPASVNDGLTHHVCKLCCAHVARWHRFLTSYIKAQVLLKDMQAKIMGTFQEDKTVKGNEVSAGQPNSLNKTSMVQINPNESLKITEQTILNNTTKKRKSNYCIARWCNNGNDMDLPFFRVPKDKTRALQWLCLADRMDLADKDMAYLYRCYLCASHFEKRMFVNENCKSLNRNAVPSIFVKPAYAQKIEEALSTAETYPKKLQGVRLKNILPKSMQKLPEISAQGSLSIPQTEERYAQVIGVVSEPHQEIEQPIQEVLLVGDSVESSSNIQIISMSPVKENSSDTFQILEVEDSKTIHNVQSPVISIVSNMETKELSESTASFSVSEVLECSAENINVRSDHKSIIYICDNEPGTSDTNINQPHHIITDTNVRKDDRSFVENVSASPNTLMDFSTDDDNVMMLDVNQKPANAKEEVSLNIPEEQRVSADTLGLLVLPSGDSLNSNMTIASSFPSENPSFLNQESLSFPSKDLPTKDATSTCLNNIVGSQDFLLMHSCSSHIEGVRDHGLRQDKNLNNLCSSIVREPVSEAPSVYGDRSMMAEASVRTIECTSPNHGQIIEGLIDLDQFLDSG